jgi:release factor glutamine methyltransferase
MRVLTLPGVFRPRSDTWMLAAALRELRLGPEHAVADVCTGSGALALTAALAGAGEVTAIDVSRRAVLTARLNARLHGVRVRGRRGDLLDAVAGERFDVIVSNPPYLPAADDQLPRRGPERAWDAGRDGRALLDRLCAQVPAHLRPGGTVLLVHSSLCDEEATLDALRAGGLEAAVVERRHGALGPLLSARAEMLEARGLLAPGAREEDVVIVRGVRPVAVQVAA